jgi:hypothetical protein
MEEKTAFTNRKIKRVRVKVVDYAFFKQDFFFGFQILTTTA